MTRTRKAALNWITSSLLGLLPLVLTLILLPKIVGYLGQERYGMFRVIAEWVGFSAIFTVGLGSFCAQRLARNLSNSAEVLAAELKRIIVFSFYVGIILFVGIGATLYFLSPVLFDTAAMSQAELNWALLWSLIALLFLPAIPIQGLFEAQQRGYQVNLVIFAQRLLIIVGSWYVATKTTSLAWQFLVIAVGAGLSSLTFIAVAKKEFPAYFKVPGNGSVRLIEVKNFVSDSLPFMKIDFAGRLSISADTLLISYIMNNSSVTLFYLAMRIPSLLVNQIYGLGNSIWAGFLEFHQLGNSAETLKLFRFVSKITIGLASLVAILVGLLNGPATSLWLGSMTINQPLFHILIGINIIPISLVSLWGWVVTALGEEKRFARISIEAALINITAGILLTLNFDFLGPALGSLIGYGLYKVFRLQGTVQKLVGFSRRQLFELLLLPLVTVTLFLVSGNWLLQTFSQTPTWWTLAMYGTLISVFFSSSLYFYFSAEEKVRIKNLLAK